MQLAPSGGVQPTADDPELEQGHAEQGDDADQVEAHGEDVRGLVPEPVPGTRG